MHELGVLRYMVNTVRRTAEENGIAQIRHIALEVGESSTFVPAYLTRLFPVATEGMALLQGAELRITVVSGTGLVIREIGY